MKDTMGAGDSFLTSFLMCYCLLYTSIDCRYISNIDPNDQAEKLRGLDPETTLVIIVSKTFTTLETLTNAREVKTWMLEQLKADVYKRQIWYR